MPLCGQLATAATLAGDGDNGTTARALADLNRVLDIDESGGLDTKELEALLQHDPKDVASAFQKLDRDHDSVISLHELDARWESVGAEMTVDEVVDWVAFSVQLPRYSDLFRQHSISGYTFPLLMEENGRRLEEIGVTEAFHRQHLVRFLKRKYFGMGKRPDGVLHASCSTELSDGADSKPDQRLVHIAWKPAGDGPQRSRLERRNPGEERWTHVYSGPDSEFIDTEVSQHSVYRLAVWNSYGRSQHLFVRCGARSIVEGLGTTRVHSLDQLDVSTAEDSVPAAGLLSMLKTYLWWWDEVIALMLFVVLPIRSYIYGEANHVLRLLRRLPPNKPTHVVVESDSSKSSLSEAAVTVSWKKPMDNGVPIVGYCVHWTCLRTNEAKRLKVVRRPLVTSVTIENLKHGETYKVVVEATNEFGLVTASSISTYLVSVPELANCNLPSPKRRAPVLPKKQCHVCLDPSARRAVPFSAVLAKKILHFCSRCDREFCHYHKGEVNHSKAHSCPAVGGRCICKSCSVDIATATDPGVIVL
ncbi:TPA: hypothetical protein N0F65_003212 [Lagenidium giganteum]|uniref:Calmodulin n=1 Tax=Lagenidium giganteum TaxID=4803 RepID=A0AAV2ZAG3_9STRA|nr:TPA: hypothetical protein N0F65_003212 [Lagenidium giganteum]